MPSLRLIEDHVMFPDQSRRPDLERYTEFVVDTGRTMSRSLRRRRRDGSAPAEARDSPLRSCACARRDARRADLSCRPPPAAAPRPPPATHVWIPASQAYDAQPSGSQGDLRVDVWLVGMQSTATPAERVLRVPPPDQALRTASGIWFLVMQSGTGLRHPAPDARVTVHYEGWTADGTRFDSSYERGKPTTFPLTAVISGWQEAVPLMVEGEKTRFWIPEDLAYGQTPGRPQGMLIFDIELIRIEE